MPVCVFKDPFRCGNNVMVLAECFTPDGTPAIGNHRKQCCEMMEKYGKLDPYPERKTAITK